MDKLTLTPAGASRRFVSLALSFGMALAALLLLGRWVGGAAAAGNPAAGNPAAGSPSAPSQPAVTFVVTATADSDDNNLNDGQCHDQLNGGCSLRAAVQQLDHDSGGLITLPAGTYNLTNNSSGDLQLLKDINITGANAHTTLIQGNPSGWTHRILRVQNGAQAILNSVTISGGHLASGNGGGISVVSGSLSLNGAIVSHNSAQNGGGIYNSGQLAASEVTLISNQSALEGGGLFNDITGTAYLIVTEVTSNSTANYGAGLSNSGQLDLDTNFVHNNTAGVLHVATGTGGGVANRLTGTLTVKNSTISANTVFGSIGGGLYNATTGKAAIVNSTVDGNQIKTNAFSLDRPQGIYNAVGAGIANIDGSVDLSSATVTSNTAEGNAGGGGLFTSDRATTTVRNTLVALNTTPSGVGPDCNGILHSQGYNLVKITAACAISGTLTGYVTGLDPKLKPLANHGGFSPTRDLLAGSPAIDAGNPSGCQDSLGNLLSRDERGSLRPNGPFCDIGAVEGVSTLTQRLLLPLLER